MPYPSRSIAFSRPLRSGWIVLIALLLATLGSSVAWAQPLSARGQSMPEKYIPRPGPRDAATKASMLRSKQELDQLAKTYLGSQTQSICSSGCYIDVVFIMDTSGSMADEALAFCLDIQDVVADISEYGIDVKASKIGITPLWPMIFDCLEGTVLEIYGDTVPGDGSCGPLLNVPESESWGPATAIVAANHLWRKRSIRVIVPLADEGPCGGDPCPDPGPDRDSVLNAIQVAKDNDVLVFPIIGTNSEVCVTFMAQMLANGTGGTAFFSTDPSTDLSLAILNILLSASCQSLTTTHFEAGLPDGFAAPIDPATPGPELATRLLDCNNEATQFDEVGTGVCFGHTFSGLPDEIVAAQLEIRLKAVDLPGVDLQCNDVIALQMSGLSFQPLWTHRIGTRGALAACDGNDGLISTSWTAGKDYTLTLDLDALPTTGAATMSLLADMDLNDRLDVRVSDDTVVDYMRLSVTYEADCNGNNLPDQCELAPTGIGFINGSFSGRSANWIETRRGDSTVEYNGQTVTITGRDDFQAGITTIRQGPVFLDDGIMSFRLMSYTSTDVSLFDFPVLLIDRVPYGLNLNGTLSNGNGIGTINNSAQVTSTIVFTIDLGALVGPGPYEIGPGVRTLNGSNGPGVAVFDNFAPFATSVLDQDCNFNIELDPCEINAGAAGVVNGQFGNWAQGWAHHLAGNAAVSYDNRAAISGSNDFAQGFSWIGQSDVRLPFGFLDFDVVGYASSDILARDYPVLHLDGSFYGLNHDGTIGPATTGGFDPGGTIDNGNPATSTVHFHVDVGSLAGFMPHEIGFGVFSLDGSGGSGTLQVDNVGPALTPLDLDCNNNGILDDCEIETGTVPDANGNFVIDTCELVGDSNGDGLITVIDLLELLARWGPCPTPCFSDMNGDGTVNVIDLLALLGAWS